jgi:cytochrome b pre-mRNA-processing protein 3
MVLGLFGRRSRQLIAAALYSAIVAQSRRGCFYLSYGVPDTVDGRFDLIVLHQALLLRRLGREADDIRRLGQDVFDMFCRDMDDNLREMGVGDLAVPKKMKGLGEAFFGRVGVYDRALDDAEDAALVAVLARNVIGTAGVPPDGALRLAAYVRDAVRALDLQEGAEFAAGTLAFPDPEAISTLRQA